jgi:NAD(P)-dependent dehydrogenase (short-subunit alcohol dehydrogenase family)
MRPDPGTCGQGQRAPSRPPQFAADRIHQPEATYWIARNTLIPRHRQPERLDEAILLAASNAGRYITGQRLVAGGGRTAR